MAKKVKPAEKGSAKSARKSNKRRTDKGGSSRTASRSQAARVQVLTPRYETARAAKKVWLTLDDGPHPRNTQAILEILDRHDIKATFFVVGRNVAAHGSLVQRAFQMGHRIGNHSYTHPKLTEMSESQVESELERTDRLIAEYTGDEKVFRPPYGLHNAMVDRVAARLGYRVVLWNVDTQDWNRRYQPDRWVQHGLDQIRA